MTEHYQRGAVLFNQGRFGDAETELRRSVAANPQSVAGRALLARTLAQLGRRDEALEEARGAVAVAPESAVGYYAMGEVCVNCGQKREAREATERALALAAGSARTWTLMAVIEFNDKHYERAVSACDRALALDPESTTAGTLRGRALANLGSIEEAHETALAALHWDPGNASAHELLGQTLAHRGDYEGARDAFREALRLNPNSANARVGVRDLLNSHHLLSRRLLAFQLWYSRQTHSVRFMVTRPSVIAFFALAFLPFPPVLHAVLITLAVLFLGAVFAGHTLSHLFLFGDPLGRAVMTRRDRLEAIGMGVVMAISIGFGIVATLTGRGPACVVIPLFLFASLWLMRALRRTHRLWLRVHPVR